MITLSISKINLKIIVYRLIHYLNGIALPAVYSIQLLGKQTRCYY